MKKNFFKLVGTIVLAAIVVFSMTGCDDPPPIIDDDPTVTSVTVSPATPSVVKGETQQFTAQVAGTNNPAQTVTWSIEQTNKNAGTTISAAGLLTVAAEETLTTLTVKATSTEDTTKSGTATVTIYDTEEDVPTVTLVTVTPEAPSVARGTTQQFSAEVTGTNEPTQTVTWSIEQTNINAGTSISATGLLTVAAAEALSSLTVKATSTVDETKSGTATVTVTGELEVNVGTGIYEGSDVLGNTYKLSVGSDAISAKFARSARSARVGDRYSFELTGRDGNKRTARGTVEGINSDGTLRLRPDSGKSYTAVIGNDNLNAVAGAGNELAEITFDDNTTITPRSFDQIQLRATRWGTPEGPGNHGEHWGSWQSVLVSDFPTNVSFLKGSESAGTIYTITMSGTSDVDMDYLQIEIQGVKHNGDWQYIGGDSTSKVVKAGAPFEVTFNNIWVNEDTDLLEFAEIAMQVTNVMFSTATYPSGQFNVEGGLGDDVEDGQLMATISNFNIKLVDTTREALKGNMSDYNFGYAADGLSIDYRQAVWSLSAADITLAKQGAMFEFVVLDESSSWGNGIPHANLVFIWQDPVRGMWWQNETEISQWDTTEEAWTISSNAVEWDERYQKYSIDLSKVINTSQFNGVTTEANFIVACWWYSDQGARSIDQLGIVGANLMMSPASTDGNMGNYRYGYGADDGDDDSGGLVARYSQAQWHLPAETLDMAQQENAQIEIVFATDLPSNESPHLILVWQDHDTKRWWPPEIVEAVDYTLANYHTGAYQYAPGVSYNGRAKKLTIDLATALESYEDFLNATNVNFVMDVWYPPNFNFNTLDIESINVVIRVDGDEPLVLTESSDISFDGWGGLGSTGTNTTFDLHQETEYANWLTYTLPDFAEDYTFITVYYTLTNLAEDGTMKLVVKDRPKDEWSNTSTKEGGEDISYLQSASSTTYNSNFTVSIDDITTGGLSITFNNWQGDSVDLKIVITEIRFSNE